LAKETKIGFLVMGIFAMSLTCYCQKHSRMIKTDKVYIYNKKLPVWIVPVSGWGDHAVDQMKAYDAVAQIMKINLEFSSRLGTFNSYKRAPAVAKEINDHNENTFAAYQKELGSDWQTKFVDKVNALMKK
jgi:hypothetical protein